MGLHKPSSFFVSQFVYNIYLAEIAPTQIRGKVIGSSVIWSATGVTLGQVHNQCCWNGVAVCRCLSCCLSAPPLCRSDRRGWSPAH